MDPFHFISLSVYITWHNLFASKSLFTAEKDKLNFLHLLCFSDVNTNMKWLCDKCHRKLSFTLNSNSNVVQKIFSDCLSKSMFPFPARIVHSAMDYDQESDIGSRPCFITCLEQITRYLHYKQNINKQEFSVHHSL